MSGDFVVKVGVQTGSVISPLSCNMELKEFHESILSEDLCTDDLVIIAESIEECVRRFLV